ncbi:TPA: type I restriction endonuclease subunit R [Haemophilus influenzae]|uniref:Type I restriction enzyme endonuclease subunit n=1 Tax=Haemophilus influenzae TaxID=727 RepID=A0ABD6WNU8_HAEIF|nr:type I restriction endonuclease subunit R [Haemophilus influenzae]MCK8983762.1 type I restriction endonuclease subunit R [Haemophilus influenzae]MCK9027932.1 type I restriction endonuclease subunit R [Haemophilus influenzae]PRL89043.1 Type-1 restriction enzyme R protein [Haemophilus influenzae]PRL90892.1 Type-1 restriction enzyme R protein [Haemophilus influenzae]
MLNENDIEQLTLQRLQSLGWEYRYGKDLPVHEGEFARGDLSGVVFIEQLRAAVRKLNPQLPESAVDSVVKSATKSDIGDLVVRNQAFYKLLRDGVWVEYTQNGEQKIEMARLVDFEHWENNRFIAVNQLEIRSRKGGKRIPDIIGFVNGLPLVVFELKNPLRESADLLQAFNQFETYKDEIAELFVYNQALIISDGIAARLGSLSADFQRFTPWKVVDEKAKSKRLDFGDELQNLLNGLMTPQKLLDYVRYFVLFERGSNGALIKKIAAYHQYYGVNEAVESTIFATSEQGDKRIGVMWHTQGSGKSISMLFYAGKLLTQPELKNPTIVVVTDRNDLDGQLFQTFSSGKDLIKQTPQQVEDREQLRQLLAQNEVGGVFFTTIQKFALNEEENRFPVLNERSNIIVISDEAHRSQYGFTQKLHNGKFQAGYARHLRDALPNASFIGFTGTPISLEDRDTQDVFGQYVSIYDLQDAVEDGATVPIIYEARQIKLAENANHDELFAEIDELLEGEENPKLRLREKLLGSEARLHDLAIDFVQHFAKRNEVVDSKAMMVVSSRQICVDLYNQIIALHPEWHSDNINEGAIKIVMTGSASDASEMQKHVYSKQEKQTLERRFKDPNDPLKVVIVRDMWLTGFDAPCCNTMYLDKPMKGHNLMQAIARVNRVFRNKSRENGGLIVDYVGIADELEKATRQYTNSQGKGKLADSVIDVFFKMKEHLEVIRSLFATPVEGKTFDVQAALEKDNPNDLLMAIRFAANHILSLDQLSFDGKAHEQHWFNKKETEPRKKAFLKTAGLVKKGYMLCGTLAEVEPYNQEIAFYDAVRAILTKREQKGTGTNERQILLKKLVNQTVYSEGVIDLFDLLEKPQPQISLLSEEFLQTVKNSPTKNLWVSAMERYLASEIKVKSGTNLTLQKDFERRLKEALNQYHNHNLTVVEILDELFKMSQDFQERLALGKKLGLTKEELAFYEALSQNQSAKDLMGDEVLSKLAKEITETLRKSVTIDWQYKEAVRARIRLLVRRALQKYKYPPDKQEEAVTYVIKQAEEIAEDLTGL